MAASCIPFPNGVGKIPVVGLGTFTVFGQQGSVDDVEVAVKAAIDAGYRHIDTAWNYGTEASIGKALADKMAEGVIKREDIFVTTKLWDTHHNPDLVMPALKDSLQKLRLDYVDLFLIHWPCALKDSSFTDPMVPKDENEKVLFASHKLEDVYKAVEECKKAGLAKDIGISNFNTAQVTRILNSCTIKPVCQQIEVTPYLDNKKLVSFCLERGILVTAYAPFGSPNRPWKESGEPSPFEEPILKEIAEAKGKSPAQVILKFHIQNGIVVIPKSVTPSRIKQNFEIFDFELSDEEMKKIASLNRNLRVFKEPIAIGHPEYPFDEPL